MRDLLTPIPLAAALVWAARHLIRLWEADYSPEDQIALAKRIFDPNAPIINEYRRFQQDADRGAPSVLFSEQQFHASIRLAFESCDNADGDTAWNHDRETFMRRALLGVTSLTGASAAPIEHIRPEVAGAYLVESRALDKARSPVLRQTKMMDLVGLAPSGREARPCRPWVAATRRESPFLTEQTGYAPGR